MNNISEEKYEELVDKLQQPADRIEPTLAEVIETAVTKASNKIAIDVEEIHARVEA